tara:strand:+ start:6032 stop:7249 length:1218 start_codon:yes stop_codon:yes gene_type:complete
MSNVIGRDELNFVTFGCWGVYCLDGEVRLKKKTQTYGGLRVSQGLQRFSHDKHLDFVTLTGDNIYSRPLEQAETGYTNRPQYDIERQMQDGFTKCFEDVRVDAFYIGVGNHDIEDCDILNAQLRYHDPRWRMPGTYYSVLHELQSYRVRMIFMDTNLYSDKSPFCKHNGPDAIQIAKKVQLDWLHSQMGIANINNEVIILSGHVPIQCNNHKFKKKSFFDGLEQKGGVSLDGHLVATLKDEEEDQGLLDFRWVTYSAELENDITLLHQKYFIDLYMCADTHNKQIIEGTDEIPVQLVCGTGGTSLDPVLLDSRTDIGKRTLFAKSSYGFAHVSVNRDREIKIDIYLTTLHDVTREFSVVISDHPMNSNTRSRSSEYTQNPKQPPQRSSSAIVARPAYHVLPISIK